MKARCCENMIHRFGQSQIVSDERAKLGICAEVVDLRVGVTQVVTHSVHSERPLWGPFFFLLAGQLNINDLLWEMMITQSQL